METQLVMSLSLYWLILQLAWAIVLEGDSFLFIDSIYYSL